MIDIDFKRWGAGRDHENIYSVEWPAVPRVGDQVDLVGVANGEVCKVEWKNDQDDHLVVDVWLRVSA